VVQRLEAEKDTTTALRAWAASGLAGRGWEMLVAGTGSEGEALHELALELGIEGSCNFVGRVEDVPQRLARSGLMLATATCDSFGLAVVEAMACGLPVVAAAAGGHLETIGPVAGAALFPARDYIAAAALLRRLAEDGSDRAAYGAQLRERQRHEYSLSAFVDRVAAWYLDVLGPRNSRSSQDRAVAGQLGLP
jgi:glycosyltransferase involved in cell wall biosynthesis